MVCPSCGSEISPYVTECPYCGKRVRKRAPKIGSREDPANRAARRGARRRERPERGERTSRVARLRPATHPDLVRPVVAPALVAVAVVVSALARAGMIKSGRLIPLGDVGDEQWKLLTAPFTNLDVGYAFVVLAAFALYGSWLERTVGRLSVAATWVVAGGAAVWITSLASSEPAVGALAAAVAVTVARAFAAIEARRDGEEQDLVGVAVVGLVLLAMPPFVPGASWYAVATGVAWGLLVGSLAVVRQRAARSG